MKLDEALHILKENHYMVESTKEEIIQQCAEAIEELKTSESDEVDLSFDTEEEQDIATEYLDSINYPWDYCEGDDDEPAIAIYKIK